MSKTSKTSLAIILLATLALTFMVPSISGISLLQQQAKAATTGQNGKPGTNECTNPSQCHIGGGAGDSFNDDNQGLSFTGNGGNGGFTRGPCVGDCTLISCIIT